MATLKKNKFIKPYIGFDLAKDTGFPFDVLIGQMGNPIVGIKIVNPVEQYSADPDSYLSYHTILNQIVTIVGENHIIQKIDIFSKKKYTAEPSNLYLQQKYSEHFDGREFRTIDTILYFTHTLDESKKKITYNYSAKRYKDLRDRLTKVFMILKNANCNPVFLTEKDYNYYYEGLFTMEFKDVPTFTNIASFDTHLKAGNNYIKAIPFVDLQRIELPNEIEPFTTLGGQGIASETAVDNFSFLNELNDFKTIVYNQIIKIPSQAQTQRDYDKKKRKHEGVASSAPQNKIVAEEIEALLHNVAVDGQLMVEAHFSIIFSADNLEKIDKLKNDIDSKLFTKGIKTSDNALNQFELFRSCLMGNATELKDYDYFGTTSEASLCFFFKESYPIGDKSNFYLRFTDRQGVPLKIDTSDLPMKTGRINNRNKFVLGPSGSGKSFLMNNIVEQYLTYNYDVVIVDTGDSYSGLSKYKNAKYIQYTEEKPITMNPFIMTKEEFNIEKIEFLGNLIFLIWKGADSVMSTTEKSIIDNLLMTYYHQYFNKGTNWYSNKSNEELEQYLTRYNIHPDDLENEVRKGYEKPATYYDLLGIPFDATSEEVKKAGQSKIKDYHPDTNIGNPNYDITDFHKVYTAYETLTDENKRKEYNETQLLVVKANEIIRVENTDKDWDERYRFALIKYIEDLEAEHQVMELSFNSFYDFAKKFLPKYLENKNHRLNDNEFNLRTFLFVLKDFYKGGRYGTTLNESADNSLFSEPFIVFEIDNVKDNPKLFPIVTLIIMDVFIQKMRLRKDRRKALIIEEAWKAIASKLMGGYILYLYKTVRKFWGEAVVVTQELDDIIGNAVVKDSIINNSDTFILLDQTKFKDNFDKIAALLSLNKVEQNKIFTINNLDNKWGRSRFKEFYLKRGSRGEVYGNEVSLAQYLTYTTEKPEKIAVEYYAHHFGDYDTAIDNFIKHLEVLKEPMDVMVSLVNLYKKPIDKSVVSYFKHMKNTYYGENIIKIIDRLIEEHNLSLQELITNKIF